MVGTDAKIAAAHKAGYDGALILGIQEDRYLKSPQWVAFKPEQIKSSIGNRGTFDPNDENILRNREKVTNSPEFQNWFSGSKAVDKDGEPMVLYHGTPSRKR